MKQTHRLLVYCIALLLIFSAGCADDTASSSFPGFEDVGDSADVADTVEDTTDLEDMVEDTTDLEDISDAEGDADSDADSEADADVEDPLGEVGEECTDNEACASGRCETFGDATICTDECTDSCPGEHTSCFEGTCVPADYCDDANGEGFGEGPGCEGSACDRCDANASCSQDASEQWSCTCEDGFEGDGIICADVDECSDTSLNDCNADATCTNVDGGFTCECNDGFEGDGTASCVVIDPCADPVLNICDANATCSVSGGALVCECEDGYSGDGESCADVNECNDAVLNTCDANAICTNTDGAFTCECAAGFNGDGESCADIDECSNSALNTCDANATCSNSAGSFSCACDAGYFGDGDSCARPASCLEALNNGLSVGDGKYTIAPGAGAEFEVYCDMTTQGGGWTLLGVQVNQDGARHWDSQAVLTDASTFGSIDTRHAADYKSPAWTTVSGDDFMIANAEYSFGFLGLLGNQSYDAHISANWPSACNTNWMRSGADFGIGLSQAQLDALGYTYRGHDNNAECFPGRNENAAVSLLATDAWVDGLSNAPNGEQIWKLEDHSILKAANIVPQTCTGGWPCNNNGLKQTASAQCYDATCKVTWVDIYVR